MGVVLALALKFPDAVVRLTAQLPDTVGKALDDMPELGGDEAAFALVNRHAVDHGAEDIELPLAGSPIADANGSGAVEAGEMLEVLLREMRVAVDAVDDLHGEVLLIGAVADPVDEINRFLLEAGAEQRGDPIGGIAQPAVAVIPIPIAPRVFGNRRRWRGA